MPTYILTPTRREAYAALFDFRTQFVQAARAILTAGEITAVGPAEGDQQLGRTYNSLDFAVGGARPDRRSRVALGGGRYDEYCQYSGVLTLMVTSPMETTAAGAEILTNDHLREIDRICSTARVLFMEHLEPFTPALLPNLDVLTILPIEPDERPEETREVNAFRVRWRITFEIRSTAWSTVA